MPYDLQLEGKERALLLAPSVASHRPPRRLLDMFCLARSIYHPCKTRQVGIVGGFPRHQFRRTTTRDFFLLFNPSAGNKWKLHHFLAPMISRRDPFSSGSESPEKICQITEGKSPAWTCGTRVRQPGRPAQGNKLVPQHRGNSAALVQHPI
jgi:hypothetical protein